MPRLNIWEWSLGVSILSLVLAQAQNEFDTQSTFANIIEKDILYLHPPGSLPIKN